MGIYFMERNQEFMLIIASLQFTHDNNKRVRINQTIDWNLFYKLTIRHRVWHQVYKALTAQGSCDDIPIYKKLEKQCEVDKKRILTTASETLRVARAFTQSNIQHCFIKGTVLNEYLYGSLLTRPCKDIDIWVDTTTLASATEALLALGYQKQLPTYVLSGFKERYYMNHKHDISFYHPERKIEIELHFRLSYFGVNFFAHAATHFKKVPLCNTLIQTLDDNYHLLYLMIHGAIHAWGRLRWLNDISLYIKNDRCSLTQVITLAQKIQCEHLVEQSLLLSRELFGVNNADMDVILQNSSPRAKWLAKMAKRFITADYEPSGHYGIYKKEFFYYRFYLARLASPGQKLQAVCGDLFKIDNLFPYITFPNSLRGMYYLLYPLWVVKYIVLRRS
jgi:hypothetical protein